MYQKIMDFCSKWSSAAGLVGIVLLVINIIELFLPVVLAIMAICVLIVLGGIADLKSDDKFKTKNGWISIICYSLIFLIQMVNIVTVMS